MAKQFKVKVTGEVLLAPVREQIADMLRYDQGTLVSNVETPVEGRPWKRVEAIVASLHYTKARWDSFGFRTELIK